MAADAEKGALKALPPAQPVLQAAALTGVYCPTYHGH